VVKRGAAFRTACLLIEVKKRAPEGALKEKTGGVLLSREVSLRVPSALAGLTALFGMGRGVSPPL
jgi:hypothetical protein